MPQTIIIETYQEFAQRHGNDGIKCGRTGWIVFSDGASVLADDADMRTEPPDDPQALLKMRRLYYREALKRAEREFKTTHNRFSEMAAYASKFDNLPLPPPDAPHILEQLAEQVRTRRATLDEIEKQLTEKPSAETLQAQAYREQLARERAKAAELLKEIQKVTV